MACEEMIVLFHEPNSRASLTELDGGRGGRIGHNASKKANGCDDCIVASKMSDCNCARSVRPFTYPRADFAASWRLSQRGSDELVK